MAAAPERVKRPTGKTTHVYKWEDVREYLVRRYRTTETDFIAFVEFVDPRDDGRPRAVNIEDAIMKMENANVAGLLYKDFKERVMVFEGL